MKHPSRPESKRIPFEIIEEHFNARPHQKSGHSRKAVFLDRDGTVNAERGYLLDPNEIELNQTAGESIRDLNDLGILVIVITNQAAIDKKLLSVEQFEKINDKLWNELAGMGAYYDALYYCPHSPEITPRCYCRKPKPGLLLQAAIDFNINLASSFMIGDKLTDNEAGKLCGCKTILVRSGYGEKAYKELENHPGNLPDFICQNLGQAVTWLLPLL